MGGNQRKPREMTRKDYDRITERYWKRVEPYFERIQAEWILEELDRKREAANKSKLADEDDRKPSEETIEGAGQIPGDAEERST